MAEIREGLELLEFQSFVAKTIFVESRALRGNSLGDPTLRRNPFLIPTGEAPAGGFPVVFLLSGLFGNGPQSFGLKWAEDNTAQALDQALARGEAPRAIFVFVDAMTAWGGSQFINSVATGNYEDYVARDLVEALRSTLPVSRDPDKWCVSGGSSGGYGALHLSSAHPQVFGRLAAIAPDSFFESSLLPDLYKAAYYLRTTQPKVAREELASGRLKKRREWHSLANAIAMGLCYAGNAEGEIAYPLDFETGVLRADVWREWKRHDPVEFLKVRDLQSIHGAYLEVGTADQFQLLYGTRQVRDIFSNARVPIHYAEFEGTHFDIGERRAGIWKWLKTAWS